MSKTIVWIEDDTDIIDPVIRPLERAGHTFIRLHSMREALEAIDTIRQAHLILLDVELPPDDAPGLDNKRFAVFPYPGLHLLEQLRQELDRLPPVVVFTDRRCPVLKQTLTAAKVADVIYMPVRPSELCRRVETVLSATPTPLAD